MTNMPAWRRYLTFWRANITADVDDELAFHRDMRVQEFMNRGMTEADARRAVAERLGDLETAKSECVELGHVRATHARRADFLDGLRADVRYALRSLARTPGWTTVALLTIALGLGATTAVFSVADRLLLRTLPYPDASRVYLARRQFTMRDETVPTSLPFGIARLWREHSRTIESAALAGGAGAGMLGAGNDTVSVVAARIDPDFFAFAHAKPLLGRIPEASELSSEQSTMLYLTEPFWRRYYGGSPDIIGKTIPFRGQPHTVLGVLPASLSIPDFRTPRADIMIMVSAESPGSGPVLVRLKPDVSPEVATAELETLMKNANLRDIRPVPMEMPLRLTRPQDWLAIRQPLVMLLGAAGLLLLVACTNVAHLLLARGAARQRELAVRHALGAGRSRLMRQLITESVVLAVVGGLLAMIVAWTTLRGISALRPEKMVSLTHVSADHHVVAIAAALAIICGLVIGLLAAVRSAHRDLGLSLRTGATSTPGGGRRLRGALVIGEVALSTTLLVGALLLVHTTFDLQRTHLGFDADGVYGVTFPFSKGTVQAEYAASLRARAAAMPGVIGLTATSALPSQRGFTALAAWETPDRPSKPEDASIGTTLFNVAPDYFSTMRMPLLAGRTFDEGSAARQEVIIGQSLARQIAPAGNAIGLRIRNAVARSRGPDDAWQTVIGVVPDVVSNVLEGARAALYMPLGTREAVGPNSVTLVFRMSGKDPTSALKAFATRIESRGPVEIINAREHIVASAAEPRFTMRILVAFAALGVILAAIGLFGVISYSVGQRTREIGVRMTLGATRSSIARLVIGDGVRLAVLGTVLGLLASIAATRLIQGMLYGVSRFDPFAFIAGAALLLVVSTIACVVPMLRATSVAPAIAVRAD